MTLPNLRWRKYWKRDIGQAVDMIHEDLENIVAVLGNANIDVWSQTPSDSALMTPNRVTGNLDGWIGHYKSIYARMQAFLAAHQTELSADVLAEVQAVLADLPGIRDALLTARALYQDGEGNIVVKRMTTAHRSALASALQVFLA